MADDGTPLSGAQNRNDDSDPTTLADKLVERAVLAVREIVNTRFNGMHDLYDKRYRRTAEWMAERFEFIDKQMMKAAADVKSAIDAAFLASAAAASKQELAFMRQIDQLAASGAQISKAIDDKVNDLKKTNDDKFGDLKDRIVAMEGRSSISDPNTAAVLCDMTNTILKLKQSRDEGSGGRQQRTESTAWIFSAIAAAVAIAVMAMEMFRTVH